MKTVFLLTNFTAKSKKIAMSEAKKPRADAETDDGSSSEVPSDVQKQRSPLWFMFKKSDEKNAVCRVCGASVHCSAGTGNMNRHVQKTNKVGVPLHSDCSSFFKRLELQLAHNKTCKKDGTVDINAWVDAELQADEKEKQQQAKKVSVLKNRLYALRAMLTR